AVGAASRPRVDHARSGTARERPEDVHAIHLFARERSERGQSRQFQARRRPAGGRPGARGAGWGGGDLDRARTVHVAGGPALQRRWAAAATAEFGGGACQRERVGRERRAARYIAFDVGSTGRVRTVLREYGALAGAGLPLDRDVPADFPHES